MVHIHSDARDHILQTVGLALQPQFGEDAHQLAAVQDDVVGPLDPGADAAGGLDAVAHGHGHPGGEVGNGGGLQMGAQQGGQIEPAATGGLEGTAQAATAPGLLLRQHHQALRRPRHGPALALGVGGVDDVQTGQLTAHQAARQRSGQLPLPHPVGGGLETIAPVGGGGDHIPLLPQGLDGLPHCGAADPQLAAHGLAGQGLIRVFPQQGQHFFPTHIFSSVSTELFFSIIKVAPAIVNRFSGGRYNGRSIKTPRSRSEIGSGAWVFISLPHPGGRFPLSRGNVPKGQKG